MKAEAKAKRIAEMFGIEAPKKETPAEARRKAGISREAEAVVLYADNPSKFLQRECRICKGTFAVNRSHIAFCSDHCRGEYLNGELGLDWDPNARSPEERWTLRTGGPEPLIVPPHVLPLVQGVLQERLPQQELEPERPQSLDEFDLSDIDALLAE